MATIEDLQRAADLVERKMAIRVIDKQKVDLTEPEWNLYQKICRSYDTPTMKGEFLFADLFHSDDSGIIIFLVPPSKRQTSFEVFLFLMSVMQNQHLRKMWEQVDDVCAQMKNKMAELESKIGK